MQAKSKYLLDSDISIWIIRGNHKVIDATKQLTNNNPVCISVATVSEMYKNAFLEEEKSYQKFFSLHSQIDIDFETAKIAGEYWKKFKKVNSNLIDYLIAATCRRNKLMLLTHNTRHYPMSDIKIIDPLSI